MSLYDYMSVIMQHLHDSFNDLMRVRIVYVKLRLN